jgi:hypothetical protein
MVDCDACPRPTISTLAAADRRQHGELLVPAALEPEASAVQRAQRPRAAHEPRLRDAGAPSIQPQSRGRVGILEAARRWGAAE